MGHSLISSSSSGGFNIEENGSTVESRSWVGVCSDLINEDLKRIPVFVIVLSFSLSKSERTVFFNIWKLATEAGVDIGKIEIQLQC